MTDFIIKLSVPCHFISLNRRPAMHNPFASLFTELEKQLASHRKTLKFFLTPESTQFLQALLACSSFMRCKLPEFNVLSQSSFI